MSDRAFLLLMMGVGVCLLAYAFLRLWCGDAEAGLRFTFYAMIAIVFGIASRWQRE